jgi:multidrug resistance efflux pump
MLQSPTALQGNVIHVVTPFNAMALNPHSAQLQVAQSSILDVDLATAEIRDRLAQAYMLIEHRAQHAQFEEVQFASQVHEHLHGTLRHEASMIQSAMQQTMHSHAQVMHAEAMIEGQWSQLQSTEQRMFEMGFLEAAAHANVT